MAEEISKPTQQQAVEYLIRLGKALHAYAFPRSPLGLARNLLPHEANRLKEEIAFCEKVVFTAACDPSHRNLRSVLDVRRDLIPDSLDIRIVAYLAWHSLTSEPAGTSVAVVSIAAGMGSVDDMIQARHAIRYMLVSRIGVLVLQDQTELLPGEKLARLLSGENKRLILFTAETLKQEAEAGQRMKADQTLRPKPCPRQSEPSPPAQTPIEPPNLLTAKGIFDALKNEVIGIDVPLRRFSAQMSLHMRRLEQIRKGVRPSVSPIVTLLIGSSGSGKTHMAESFARVSGLPYSVADMSGVSQASYVGLSVDECFYGLLANKTKPSEAQKGILVMDEFDKLCAKGGGSHSSTDPQGRGIQAELLKPLEGCKLPLGSRRSNSPYMGVLDCWETSFLLCGAFQGLRDLLADGNRKATGLGFGSTGAKAARSDIRDALVKYGFMEQIVNRIGAIIVLSDPTPEQIVRITTHANGLLARQNAFLSSFGMSLDLTDEAIQYLANWACEIRGYSRAVKTILGTLVEGHLYDEKPDVINVWLKDVKRAIEETEGAEGLQK